MELKRKDTVKKTHEGYIHTTVIEYPRENVINMMKSWKEKLEEGGQWLEGYDKMFEEQLAQGFAELDKNVETVKAELEILKNLSEEELIKRSIDANKKYIQLQEEFIKNAESRKQELRVELDKQLSGYKKQMMQDMKEKKEALKAWTKAMENGRTEY